MNKYKPLSIPSESSWDKKTWRYYTPIWFNSFVESLTNTIKWLPTIWKDRHWDDHYIFEILKKKLEFQRAYLVKHNRHIRIDIDNRDITICLNLIDKIQNSIYEEEYQQYIDDEIIFGESLINGFILNETLFKKSVNLLLQKYSTFYFDDFIIAILKRLTDLNINVSESTWEKWINILPTYNWCYNYVSAMKQAFLINKNANFIKVILKNKDLYNKYNPSYVIFDEKILAELDADEKQLFKELIIDSNSTIKIPAEKAPIVLELFSVDEILSLENIPRIRLFVYITSGDILKDFSQEEIQDIIIKKVQNNENVINISGYFLHHKDLKLSDDFVDNLFDAPSINNAPVAYQTFLLNTINNFTIDQIVKYNKYFNFQVLITKNDLSLKQIQEWRGKQLKDISTERFFTEEEIKECPEYFKPSNITLRTRLYVSKDTFKLLNKTWSQRQRYNDTLTAFISIINGLQLSDRTIKNLKYLQGKCSASNAMILKVINTWNKSGDKNLEVLNKFNKKFEDK